MKTELLLSYPRKVEFGKRYPVIIDLEHKPGEWKYEQEHFSLPCILSSHHLVTKSENNRLTIYRQASSEPARFIVWARHPGITVIRLTLLSEGGVPIHCQDLTGIQVEEHVQVSDPMDRFQGRTNS